MVGDDMARTVAIVCGAALAGMLGVPAPAGARLMPVACTVVDGAKLPSGIGGDDLCAAIREAMGPHSSDLRVVVRVTSPSRLTASVTTAAGRSLPEQHFAVSDKTLTKEAIRQFAADLAVQVKDAAR